MLVVVSIPAYNEEKTIGSVLDGIPDSIDGISVIETIVIDDGSTDQTPAVAEQLGATVKRTRWKDNFATARNRCLQELNGDWILWLDAGEQLTRESADELRALLDAKADPTKLFLQERVQNFQKEDKHYTLSVTLPFIEKGDISLTQNRDELIIRVGKFKRNIILPHILVGWGATEAKFEDGELKIRFQQQEGGEKDD